MAFATEISDDSESGLKASLNQAGLKLMGGLRLIVEDGLHVGAKTTIQANSFTLGSSEKSDVVLLADDLAAHHAQISLLNPWNGKLRVEAQEMPIQTLDGYVVENGRYIDLTLPAQFKAGKAEFRVESAQDITRYKKLGVILTAVVMVAFFLPSIPSTITPNKIEIMPAPSAQFPTMPIPTGNMPFGNMSSGNLSSNNLSLDQWRSTLQEKLAEAALVGQVSLEKGNTGNLIAVGSVEPQALDKWRDILKWYDSQSGAPLLVNNVTRADVAVQIPTFRAIWVDANPQVILSNGQSAKIGDIITGGWKVEAIEPTGVLLTRDGRTTRVAF